MNGMRADSVVVRRTGSNWSWLAEAAPPLLILGSAFTAPLLTAGTFTLTGDRLLGLAALGVAISLAVAGRLRWTPIHTALAVFVGAQVLTSMLNAGAWPRGLKLVTVYVLGFACFCLAAEAARGAVGRNRFVTWWIVIGAGLGLIGAVVSAWANLSQEPVWGSGIVQGHRVGPPALVFAAMATFGEWNLFSSFLLIPLALGLWRLAGDARAQWLTACLGAIVLGLAFGFSRGVWLSTAGIIALWWWTSRPGKGQLAALGAMLALAFLLLAATTSGPVPLSAYRAPAQTLKPEWAELQRQVLQRDGYLALEERRKVRWIALKEKRALNQFEMQRIEQLSGEITRIGQAMRALEPPFWTRGGIAYWLRSSAIWSRVVQPIKTGDDWNSMGRLAIGRVTLESWIRGPMLGHGAGSVNQLSVWLRDGSLLERPWNGNLVLFVLHDSGLLGLAAIVGLGAVVWRRARRARSHEIEGAAPPSPTVPLLVAGGALCFAYQFTHALWLMYPYVYLGLLAAVTEPGGEEP